MANEGAAPDFTVGLRTLAVLSPLLLVALAVFAVRIWTRCRPKFRLNSADYTICISMLAELLIFILTAVAVSRGFGRPLFLLSPAENNSFGPAIFAIFILSPCALAFARISICCLLLNITQERVWRLVLWTTILLQSLILGSLEILQLVQCRPIRANWAFVPDGSCISPDRVFIIFCVFGAISTASDVICAVFPILIIWRLTRSMVERVLVSLLLGLGLLAAIGCVLKLVILKSWDPTSVYANRGLLASFMWIRIEETLLIIGACAPTLKGPIQDLLKRCFGFRQREDMEVPTVITLPESSAQSKPSLWKGSWQNSSSDETLGD